jgi:hypothetical protein
MRLSFRHFVDGPGPDVPLHGADGATVPFLTEAVIEEPGEHTLELTIAMWRVGPPGPEATYRPGVEAVVLQRNPDLPPITARDLRRVQLDRLVRTVVAQAATGDPGDIADAAVVVRRRRNEVTAELLRLVAGHHSKGGADAVREALKVSRSQAYRLVAKARQAGLIQPKEHQS